MNEFCQVVYLERTAGISSTDLRTQENTVRIGVVGDDNELPLLEKFVKESHFVNGAEVRGICVPQTNLLPSIFQDLPVITDDYTTLIEQVDAIYILSRLDHHYKQIKYALEKGKHVLCESPITKTLEEWRELSDLAKSKGLVLTDAIRTAFSMAYYRMLLLVKSGCIGDVVSVDASCSSLRGNTDYTGSLFTWGPNALLPVFQILGTEYRVKQIQSLFSDDNGHDKFSKISFVYPNAVASVKVGLGVKTEGELVVSGTTGYVYVPAPWWKMDYFEIRREDPAQNKRYFYQLDGEGIRYEIVYFLKNIRKGNLITYISEPISQAIVREMEDFHQRKVIVL